jgi:hypothetical protein
LLPLKSAAEQNAHNETFFLRLRRSIMLAIEKHHARRDRLGLESLECRALLAGDLHTAAVDSMTSSQAEVDSTSASSNTSSHTAVESGLLDTHVIDNAVGAVQNLLHQVTSQLRDLPAGSELRSIVDGVVAKAVDALDNVQDALNDLALKLNLKLDADVLGNSVNAATGLHASDDGIALKSLLNLNLDGFAKSEDVSAKLNAGLGANVSADKSGLDADVESSVATGLKIADAVNTAVAGSTSFGAHASESGASVSSNTAVGATVSANPSPLLANSPLNNLGLGSVPGLVDSVMHRIGGLL